MADESMIPKSGVLPQHIAIIMDGNGRWAEQRCMPRAFGHQAGVKAVRKIVEACAENQVKVLTLFAFSSENWRRPQDEVSLLMTLFASTLQMEVEKLHRNNIRLRFIGDRSAFAGPLRQKMAEGEVLTQNNTALTLVIAVNYGGQWDLCQAFETLCQQMQSGVREKQTITPELVGQHLSTADLPDPDLFIRTGGEQRVSNFMLWQLAYTELYFSPLLWPDFDRNALQEAISSFKSRQRRFGYTGEQILKTITS